MVNHSRRGWAEAWPRRCSPPPGMAGLGWHPVPRSCRTAFCDRWRPGRWSCYHGPRWWGVSGVLNEKILLLARARFTVTFTYARHVALSPKGGGRLKVLKGEDLFLLARGQIYSNFHFGVARCRTPRGGGRLKVLKGEDLFILARGQIYSNFHFGVARCRTPRGGGRLKVLKGEDLFILARGQIYSNFPLAASGRLSPSSCLLPCPWRCRASHPFWSWPSCPCPSACRRGRSGLLHSCSC